MAGENKRDIKDDDRDFEFGVARPGDGTGGRDSASQEGGVYPLSGEPARDDADVQTQAEMGQGERGAEGYEDHGNSELGNFGPEDKVGPDER